MILGCIADDYTGATDLSSMLVRAGLSVIQIFGPRLPRALPEVDAIVVALKSRSTPSADAVRLSLEALASLRGAGAQRFFFKYCSTFDSTPAGNIGPVAEALAAALGVSRVLYCPAFPENGRTVHCGYLFVNRVPLHESGMKDHPLNPMTDSNLVRVLRVQCREPVGLLGASGDGAKHWIVDAISNDDLRRVARLAKDDVLLTGGSAIARYWAAEIGAARGQRTAAVPRVEGPVAMLAGSCSQATRDQIAAFERRGHPVLRIGPGTDPAMAVAWWQSRQPGLSLIASCPDARALDAGAGAAQRVESLFGELAKRLVDLGARRMVAAGGETAGSVINVLGIDAIRIGSEISPGVPIVYTLGAPQLVLALKSGNFGGPEFFTDAVRAMEVEQ